MSTGSHITGGVSGFAFEQLSGSWNDRRNYLEFRECGQYLGNPQDGILRSVSRPPDRLNAHGQHMLRPCVCRYPIMQCALLVSALWGVFVFGEITDRKTIFVLFVSGLVLLGGAGVLSISVDSN